MTQIDRISIELEQIVDEEKAAEIAGAIEDMLKLINVKGKVEMWYPPEYVN